MKSSILFGLLVSASAFGASSKSSTQYLYQPNGGQQAAELDYTFNFPTTHNVSYNGGFVYNTKRTVSDFNFSYLYGISDDQTVGASITYGSDSVSHGLVTGSTTVGASGFGDLNISYLGKTDWSGFALYYGAVLGVNLEQKKLDSTTGLADNRASGGLSLTPEVALLGMTGPWNYGLELAYAYPFTRTVNAEGNPAAGGANETVTGGGKFEVTPFAEYNYGVGIATFDIPYVMSSASTTSIAGNNTTGRSQNYWGLELGGTYDFTETLTGIAKVSYTMYPQTDNSSPANATSGTSDAYNNTSVAVGARFTF